MSLRLVDAYPIGLTVEIRFGGDPQSRWRPGVVTRHEHPGVWVAADGGREWFVTNARRIRPVAGRQPDGAPPLDET